MISILNKLLGKHIPIIRFSAIRGAYNISMLAEIKLAKSLDIQPLWIKNQKKYDNSSDKFLNCPGMADLMKIGYIIPAPCNIKIKANKAGTVVILDDPDLINPVPMNEKLLAGLVEVNENVKFSVTKISMPWAIFTKSGYSVHVLPAFYHSPFLKDLYVYPGTVDYDVFHHCNFIFSAIRECEIEIAMGTPLLQVIPFKREDVTGICMKASSLDNDIISKKFPAMVKSAYRKFFHKIKSYTLENK